MSTTIIVAIAIILSALAGATATAVGVWLGGLVKHQSALAVENQYLREETAKFKAEAMIFEGRIKLLDEARANLEKQCAEKEAAESAKGDYIPANSDPSGGTLSQGGILKDTSDEEAAQALGDNLFANSKRLQDQLLRTANPVAPIVGGSET